MIETDKVSTEALLLEFGGSHGPFTYSAWIVVHFLLSVQADFSRPAYLGVEGASG